MTCRPGLPWCAVTLAVGLAGISTGQQPAANREPAAIVVRSVRLPDNKDPAPPRAFAVQYGLTHNDFDACRQLDGVERAVPVRFITQSEVRHLDRQCEARVVATTEGYAGVRPVELAAGRFLKDQEDESESANVAVLGAGVARDLFPGGETRGDTVLVRGCRFAVVGVLKTDPAGVHDRDVFIPMATSRGRFGKFVRIRRAEVRFAEGVDLHEIIVTPKDPARLRSLADAIRGVLEKSHEARDWEVVPPPRPREEK